MKNRWEDDTDDTPTPRQSGSWAIMSERCKCYAERLDKLAIVSRKRLDMLDLKKAEEYISMAAELRSYIPRFDAWPNNPAQMERERGDLIPRVLEIQGEVDDVCWRLGW